MPETKLQLAYNTCGKYLQVAIDFDGTLVSSNFPDMGYPNPLAFKTLIRLQQKYMVQYILYTLRSGTYRRAAVQECIKRGLTLYSVNENPYQRQWEELENQEPTEKVHADLYIDDRNLGCPLKEFSDGQIMVDWEIVGPMLEELLKVKGYKKS